MSGLIKSRGRADKIIFPYCLRKNNIKFRRLNMLKQDAVSVARTYGIMSGKTE